MRHGGTRDRYGEEQNVLCFEMEAAGLMDNHRCIVIRGICDYADSHKTKEWQNYAATVAAAYGKEFLSYTALERVANIKPAAKVMSQLPLVLPNSIASCVSVPSINYSCHMLTLLKTVICPYPRNTQFVGRGSILGRMRKEFQHVDSTEVPQAPRTVVIFGLGGVGYGLDC